jgi:hypothetical protein
MNVGLVADLITEAIKGFVLELIADLIIEFWRSLEKNY